MGWFSSSSTPFRGSKGTEFVHFQRSWNLKSRARKPPSGISETQKTPKPLLAGLLPRPAPCSPVTSVGSEGQGTFRFLQNLEKILSLRSHQLFISSSFQSISNSLTKKTVARQACSQILRRRVPRICHLISPSLSSCLAP